jgi:hypothetical protein
MISKITHITIALITLLLGTLMTGCVSSATPKANLTGYTTPKGDPLFPAVAIITTSEDLQYREPRVAFIGALNESRAFRAIEIGNPYAPIVLEVYVSVDPEGGDIGSEVAKATLFGASLGLVPVGVEFRVTGRVRVRLESMVIDEFEFGFVHSTNLSLFNMDSKDIGWRGAFRKAAETTLEMLLERETFNKIMIIDPDDLVPTKEEAPVHRI